MEAVCYGCLALWIIIAILTIIFLWYMWRE